MKRLGRMPVLNALAALFLLGLVAACGIDEGDISAPLIAPSPDNAYVVRTPFHTLTGTMEEGARIQSEPYGTASIACGTPTSTTWACILTQLAPGINSFFVKAIDRVGNQNSLNLTVTYDLLAIDRLVSPVLPLPDDTAVYQVRGTVADGVAPGVTLIAATLPALEAAVAVEGQRWTATFTGPIAAGSYVLTATRTDADPPQTRTFSVLFSDAGFPEAIIDELPFEVAGPDPLLPVSGRIAPEQAGVVLRHNNRESPLVLTPAPPWVLWDADITLRPGKNFLTLTVTDALTQRTTTAFDAVWYAP